MLKSPGSQILFLVAMPDKWVLAPHSCYQAHGFHVFPTQEIYGFHDMPEAAQEGDNVNGDVLVKKDAHQAG